MKYLVGLALAGLIVAVILLALSGLGANTTALVSAQANLEAARAMQESARAIQTQAAAGVAGQCLTGFFILAALGIGGGLVLLGLRAGVAGSLAPAQGRGELIPQPPARAELPPGANNALLALPQAARQAEPEDRLFANWW